MVDIYSRFLFEQKVVAAQADHALDVDELKETMLWAQDQSYGDGSIRPSAIRICGCARATTTAAA
ncbi:MAG: hypothetical protein ACLUI3_13180 [Christensenellales bacterium]